MSGHYHIITLNSWNPKEGRNRKEVIFNCEIEEKGNQIHFTEDGKTKIFYFTSAVVSVVRCKTPEQSGQFSIDADSFC